MFVIDFRQRFVHISIFLGKPHPVQQFQLFVSTNDNRFCDWYNRDTSGSYCYDLIKWYIYAFLMRRSNCSAPIPTCTPRDIIFLGGCPGLFITLFLPCPALIDHFNPLILECLALFLLHFPVPRPFLSHKCFLWPRGCPGGIGAEQFDRRITGEIMYKNDTLIEYGRVRKGCGFRFPFQSF